MSEQTEIILSQKSRESLREFSAEQFATQMLSAEINNAAKAYFVSCLGAELGLSPMQSLRSIYVIKGKPVLSAAAIHAIVVKHRDVCEYLMLVESSEQKCTYETKRVGDPGPTKLTWTIQQAQRAGLLNNPTWKAHTEAMLRARCVAAICRAVYPDLAMGLYEEGEGEEIRGEGRVTQSTSTPEAPAQLPAAESENSEPAEWPAIGAAIEIIKSCTTFADLQAKAKEFKDTMPQVVLDGIREPYLARRIELQIEEILADAKKPDADLKALWKRAESLKGLTVEQEKQLAELVRKLPVAQPSQGTN